MAIINLAYCLQAQDFIWAKQMGGTNSEAGTSIAIDGSGNIYTAGHFAGTVDFDPGVGVSNMTSAGQGDFFISKLDASGNFVWAKQFGNTFDEFTQVIAVDNSGNVFITGNYIGTVDFDPGPGVFNLTTGGGFVSRLNSSGDFVWAFMIPVMSSNAIALDLSNNVYITGQFGFSVDMDPGSGTANLTALGASDIFVAKYSGNGIYFWAKNFGGTDINTIGSQGSGSSIAVDGSGNVYTTGSFQNTVDFNPDAPVYNLTAVSDNAFVSKLDNTGAFFWAVQLNTQFGNAIAVDGSGNVIITGLLNNTNVDFDPGPGQFLLSTVLGYDVFVWKLSASSGFIWAKQMGGTGNEYGYSLALDNIGNVFTGGYFGGVVDFDPGPGVFNMTAEVINGGSFLSKLDASGNFVSAKQIKFPNDIAIDPTPLTGGLFITGGFGNTVDFDPGPGSFNMTSVGLGDIFILKLGLTAVIDADGDGYSVAQGDCNDNNAAIHPGAIEVCNAVDDDCDGLIDEGVTTTYYRDADVDGYGNAAVTISACSLPSGYVSNSTDCNDANAAIHPGATEVCNGVDDDCDGLIDEGVQTTYYRDADVDGYGNAGVTILACSVPSGYVSNSTDCNDANAAIHPGAIEVCNGVDDNCNGTIDEGCSAAVTLSIADGTVYEAGGPAIIPVSLSATSASTITVKYKTINGSARQPKDYSSTSGTITFLPGETSKNISVPIIADAITEGNENFFITLSRPSNATISDGSATVTITETAPLVNNYKTGTEIKSETEKNLVIFNPQRRTEQLRFYGIELGTFDVIISDLNGKTIYREKNYRNNWIPNQLPTGIYVYQLLYKNLDGELKRRTGKLLIIE